MNARAASCCALGALLTFGLAACTLKFSVSLEMSGAASDTPAPVPATSPPVASLPAPTETPSPSPMPAATEEPRLGPARVSPEEEDVRCRFGPGEEWSIEGELKAGTSVPIAGRNKQGTWWYVDDLGYKGRPCWVPGEGTRAEGDLEDVPVQASPAAIVSVVKVSVEPWKATIPCGDFPYSFRVKFTISTSGPATVTFQRSRNGDTDPAETVTFKTFGTKTYNEDYTVDEVGEYRFRVNVTSPNKIAAEDKGKMECDP